MSPSFGFYFMNRTKSPWRKEMASLTDCLKGWSVLHSPHVHMQPSHASGFRILAFGYGVSGEASDGIKKSSPKRVRSFSFTGMVAMNLRETICNNGSTTMIAGLRYQRVYLIFYSVLRAISHLDKLHV